MIRNKKIKINVLGDRLFEDYLGVSSDTLAVAVGDQIYLRRSSSSILSEIVHEGTHALDFINKIDVNVISSWTGETRAYSAERKFQIASGGPVDFEKEEDMMTHIMKNYKSLLINSQGENEEVLEQILGTTNKPPLWPVYRKVIHIVQASVVSA